MFLKPKVGSMRPSFHLFFAFRFVFLVLMLSSCCFFFPCKGFLCIFCFYFLNQVCFASLSFASCEVSSHFFFVCWFVILSHHNFLNLTSTFLSSLLLCHVHCVFVFFFFVFLHGTFVHHVD